MTGGVFFHLGQFNHQAGVCAAPPRWSFALRHISRPALLTAQRQVASRTLRRASGPIGLAVEVNDLYRSFATLLSLTAHLDLPAQ